MPTADQYYDSKELFHFRWFVLFSYFVADQEPVWEEPARSVTALSTPKLELDIQITFIAEERKLKFHEFESPETQVQADYRISACERYSYCLNPLIYTDPDGELIWIIPNIGWNQL